MVNREYSRQYSIESDVYIQTLQYTNSAANGFTTKNGAEDEMGRPKEW